MSAWQKTEDGGRGGVFGIECGCGFRRAAPTSLFQWEVAMKTEKYDVLVAGAGPVGLTAALALRKVGLKTAVIEAGPGGVTHSYALALHSDSVGFLNELGGLDDLLPDALKVRFISIYANGKQIARLPVAPPDAEFPYMTVYGQDVLERALVAALKKAGCPVLWSHRLARFEQTANEVLAEVDELEERVLGYAAAHLDWLVGCTRSMESRILIGADGHHSLVRRQLGIDFPETRAGEHFAVFEFQVSDKIADEVALCFHEDGLAVLWPLPGGRARWSFAVNPETTPEARREKDIDPVQVIGPGIYPALAESFFAELLKKRAPWFTAGIKNVYWKLLVRFERRLASKFGDGRVWLAGDAAHLTGPAGIQSMNIGLREAMDLAHCVYRSEKTGWAVDCFEGYEKQRQTEWQRMLSLSGNLEAASDADPAIVRNLEQLPSSLPASGNHLVKSLGGLGVRFVD
jgi:2-polyprenyl-6-methoxyphenol hydroxylase-like FAD-dependent oxidoreductase